MTVPDAISDDHILAHDLAAEAADRLDVAQRLGLSEGKRGWLLEDVGDQLAHNYLVHEISRLRPDDGLLSEEGHDDGERVGSSRSWIVDPLDGSSGFGYGNGEWAVHVAMAVDGEPLVGAVAVPSLGLTASTQHVPVVPSPDRSRPVVVTGRTRGHRDGSMLVEALDADLSICSSAGVKAMLVAVGRADIYVHDAPLYEWDVCAPVAVALAAGLSACGPDGHPLRFNKPSPIVDGLVICRPEFTTDVIGAIGRFR